MVVWRRFTPELKARVVLEVIRSYSLQLILDEVGFVPFTLDGARLLFQVCADRYLRGSILITTNLEFSRWAEIFGDERLTGALLDRLTHRCHVLEFNREAIPSRKACRPRRPSRMLRNTSFRIFLQLQT
jgi:DNA replication protein DnaC